MKRNPTVYWAQVWWMAFCGVAGSCAGAGAATDSGHWSFQSLRPVRPPPVREVAWVRTPIDRFILSDLEKEGLAPAAAATPEQLIRRVTFDLIGLPPTPEEVDDFVREPSEQAYERLLDRLLASPQYGERWARHWLDLARFAESDGFEHDALRPHAWRYRDYVIRSFNEDKPYDRFIREQMAGDELWPGDPAALTATAFHLLGPDMVDSSDQMQRRLNTLNDATDTTAAVILGLTLGCARCHDHKFEPFTQRDYFSLQAFFTPAMFRQDQPIPTPAERAAHEVAQAAYRDQAGATQNHIDELERPHRAALLEQKLAGLSEEVRKAHETPPAARTPEQDSTVRETAPQLKVSEAELVAVLSAEERATRDRWLAELKHIAKPTPLPMTQALQNSDETAPRTHVLIRGDYNQPGEEVQPGYPEVLVPAGREPNATLSEPAAPRAALAAWLTDPSHPLTARVMVNRVWAHHFGRGIVATPSDFGWRGAAPTHPELLDWLAMEFMARGWSLKALHKLMLLSSTYRQASTPSPDALRRDPENRLFSRQNRVRLEGEVLRDSLLAISGRLNPAAGGPGVSPPIAPDITRTSKNWTASAEPEDHARRSIYILARRNLRFPFLEVFDAPDSNLSCPERGRSTTAPQALTLLNSGEVQTAARLTAQRLAWAAPTEPERIALAFRFILGVPPTTEESALAGDFLRASRVRAQAVATNDPATSDPVAAGAGAEWIELCRALFNLNRFVYVD